MSEFDIILYLIYNFLRILISVNYIKIFFNNQKVNKYLFIASILVYFVVNSGIYIFIGNNDVNLLSNIVMLYLATFVYGGKIYQSVLSTFCIAAIEILVESITYITISHIMPNNDVNILLAYILSNGYMLIMLWIIIAFFKKYHQRILKFQYYFILSILSALLMYIAVVIFKNMNTGYGLIPIYTIVAIVMLLFINLLVIYFFYEMNKQYQNTLNNKMIEQQNMYYRNQLDIIKESNEKINKLKHDYKNHAIVMQNILDKRDSKGLEYTEDLLAEIENIKLIVNSGNIVIDSLLNFKLKDYKSKGIDVKIDIAIPEELCIPDFDLNIIVGNLLDNALRAVENCDNKEIIIVIKFIDNALFIKIVNTFANDIKIENDTIATTKANKKEHGYGIKNIRAIVQKYVGNMSVEVENNKFKVIIVLCTEK